MTAQTAYCKVADCWNAPVARNLCNAHYQRLNKLGSVMENKPLRSPRLRDTRKNHVGYAVVHNRLIYDLGSPRAWKCLDCDENARDWSLSPMTPAESIVTDARGRTYSLDARWYEPRCHRCHMRYDLFRKRSNVA